MKQVAGGQGKGAHEVKRVVASQVGSLVREAWTTDAYESHQPTGREMNQTEGLCQST